MTVSWLIVCAVYIIPLLTSPCLTVLWFMPESQSFSSCLIYIFVRSIFIWSANYIFVAHYRTRVIFVTLMILSFTRLCEGGELLDRILAK